MEMARLSLRPITRSVAWLLALHLSIGCQRDTVPELTLQAGPDQILRFSPRSGFAKYVEIPGQGDMLRIVLASYPLTCQSYAPPAEGEVFVSVTVHARSGEPMSGAKIPWDGSTLDLAGQDGPSPTAESEEPVPRVWALPLVRLAKDARPLPPGGSMTITRFSREPYGVVEGEFQFSDAAEGEAATAALMGSFKVQLCHVDLDPSRPETTEEKPGKKK